MTDDNDLHRLGLKLKFAYSIVGLVVGLICIIVGMVLGLAGVSGHTNWTADLLGLSTNLNDAAPGVIVFIVGIFVTLITRFRVKHSTESTIPDHRAKAGERIEASPAPVSAENKRIEVSPAPVSAENKKQPVSGGGGGVGKRRDPHERFTSNISYSPPNR
jgi:hypothetical protein